jgi:APA family basic amino acid/polyamine antiporter
MASGLFATKAVEQLLHTAENGEHGLKRALGAIDLTMLGVGAIIGAGIFVLTGNAAAQHAGPAIVLSMVLAGVACAFAGLCYSEMASMIPIAGSAYTYSYATLGEFLAWIIGWDLILEYALGAATVSVGWSGLAVSFLAQFGIGIPPRWTIGPFESLTLADGTLVTGVFNLPALVIVLVITAILIVGVRESANVNTVIVFVKVGVVVALIILGLRFMVPANWTPFIPPNTGSFGEFGWSGILTGAGKIFFAYIGFDAVSTAAQEAKNPQRDLPRGILGSLVACTILYVLFAGVLTGVVHYTELDSPAPVAVAVDRMEMPFMGQAMKLGAIAGLTSVMLVMLYSQARIFWIMSSDGLLPKAFSTLHARFRTPYLSSLITGFVVAIAGGVFPIGTLGDMVSIGTLFAFVLVCAGVMVLRRTKPDLRRPFRTPLVPLVPILGMLCCLGLMSGLGLHTWERLLIWLVIGLAIYFTYGRFHSVLRQKDGGSARPPASLASS